MFSQTWYHSSCYKAQQTTQSENENTNDDINIKQQISYLVSNDTMDKNDKIVTTERNVKEFTSVESIFQKMAAMPEGGKSM